MSANIEEEKIPTEPIKLDIVDGDDERVIASDAREMLGVSKVVMARLLREGTLPYESDELDKRLKWIKVADLRKLKRHSSVIVSQNGDGTSKQNGSALASVRGETR